MFCRIGWLLAFTCLLSSCVEDRSFEAPDADCTTTLVSNATFSQVKALYQDGLIQIQEDWVIEGFVVSSDEASNFFSVLHFQDNPSNPTEGFQISIDVRDTHLFYPVGTKIFIKLKGLYLGQTRGVFRLGGTFAAFGTTSVGRLPALKVPEHIFVSCDQAAGIVPTPTNISTIMDRQINTLVTFDQLEFAAAEIGLPFASAAAETERTLTDCEDNELLLVNSGFSDFQADALPSGNGRITGVLLKENDDFQLAIRTLGDMDFQSERCEDVVTEFTSNRIFFSELADPDNNASARFLELYNAGDSDFDLNGWQIRRYTNANTEVSSTIDLSGLIITAQSTLVISPNAGVFETVYGFLPDLAVGTNSPADSNGDDNLELIDPFGTVIDVFGVIGMDGTGTNHEFEDGRANRREVILMGSPLYTFGEWLIFNDSGDAGTTNLPQMAPEDFTPGIR